MSASVSLSSGAAIVTIGEERFELPVHEIEAAHAFRIGTLAGFCDRDRQFGLEVTAVQRAKSGANAAPPGLAARFPGRVVKVMVGDGDQVEAGQTLVVLESMKMEFVYAAPHAGIAHPLVTAGQMVEKGAPLAEVRT